MLNKEIATATVVVKEADAVVAEATAVSEADAEARAVKEADAEVWAVKEVDQADVADQFRP